MTGVTIHVVDEHYDHGRIIGQSEVPVFANDTVESLTARVQAREQAFYVEILQSIAAGQIRLGNGSLAIRRYQDSDRAAVWFLHNAGLDQFGANAGHGPWDADLGAIEATYFDNGGEFLVGTCDGNVVAMGALRRSAPDRAEIKRMRVHPDFQRRGFGQAMLGALESRARELSYRLLHLDTTVQQLPAQQLYLKNGFVAVGRKKLGGFDSILYEKRISPPGGS